jgi:hypothetical protein
VPVGLGTAFSIVRNYLPERKQHAQSSNRERPSTRFKSYEEGTYGMTLSRHIISHRQHMYLQCQLRKWGRSCHINMLSVVKTIYRDRIVFKVPFDNTICPEIIQSRFQYPNCVQRSESCAKFGFDKFLNGKRKYGWNRKEKTHHWMKESRGCLGI